MNPSVGKSAKSAAGGGGEGANEEVWTELTMELTPPGQAAAGDNVINTRAGGKRRKGQRFTP